jgi:opacity protein-like surface antigen
MRIIVPAIFVILVFAVSASAQTGPGISGYAGGGISFPFQDLNTYWKQTFHGTIGIGMRLTPGLDAVGRYAYRSFGADADVEIEDNIGGIGEDFKIHEYGIDLSANLSAPGVPVRPFGLIGIGLAKIHGDSEFFYTFGGGIKAGLMPKIDLIIEIRYNKLTLDELDISYMPITIAIGASL